MKKLICIFSVIFLITAKAEDGAWVFLHSSPLDELVSGTVGGSLSTPVIINGEILIQKWGTGVDRLIASDGSLLGTYTKILDASEIEHLGNVIDNFGVINGNIILQGVHGDLVSWDGVSELTTTLTPAEVINIGNMIQCGPDDLFGEQVYFTATTAAEGKELWVTTGTAIDTFMIGEISLGSVSTDIRLFITGYNLCNDSTLYFMADDGLIGRELWGATRAGTFLVRDGLPGSYQGFNGNLRDSTDGNIVFSGNVPCDVNSPCMPTSPEFPFGTTSGIIRAYSGPGYGDVLKLTNPQSVNLFREGLSPGLTYTASLANSGKLYKHDGLGNTTIVSDILGRPDKMLDFPNFSILITNQDSNNNGGRGAYILDGITEIYVSGLEGVETNRKNVVPFNNGHVFIGKSNVQSGYDLFYSDGAVNGTYELVDNVSSLGPTVFGDSIFYTPGNCGACPLFRYGPAKDPEIGFLGSLVMNEDNNTGDSFIVGGSVTEFSDLTTTALSLNTNLIQDQDINIIGNHQIRSFGVQTLPDQYGDAEIELTVEDHRGWTASTTVPISILPVNDEPSFDFVTDEVRIPSNTADTFIFENFIENIDFGPNEQDQSIESFSVFNWSGAAFIDDISIDTSGTLSISTNGASGSAASIRVQMYDNGGTERGGDNVSQQKTFTVFAQTPVDVEVTGQYLGTSNGSHMFEYTVSNKSTNIDLGLGDLTINSLSSQMTNVTTNCISNCTEAATGNDTSFEITLDRETPATIQVTGEFNINANPGITFTSTLSAQVSGTQLDANTSNNEVTIEMPQIVFRSGFE